MASLNLIEMAKNYLTPDLVEKLSNAVGLSPDKTQSALEAAVPTALAGVLHNASTEQGAKRVFDTLKQGSFDGSMLNNLGERVSGGNLGNLLETGKGLLGNLFGDRTDAVSEQLSRSTGVDRSAITKILAVATPFVMNLLGKVKKEQGLSEGGVRELLMSQKDTILKYVPSGLAGALGLSSLSDLGGIAGQIKEKVGGWVKHEGGRAQPVSQSAYTSPRQSPTSSKAIWVALAALAVLAGFWLIRGRGREMARAPEPAPVTSDSPRLRGEPTGNLVRTTLPNGESIQLDQDSTAYQLVEVLKKEPGPSGSERIVFKELEFVPNRNVLETSSSSAIERVATILKAYPNARIRIRSYTQEETEVAERLAKDRADRIRAQLTERGVPAERVNVEQVPAGETAQAKPKGGLIELVVEASR